MSLSDRFISRYEDQIAALLSLVRKLEESIGPEDDWIEDDRRVVYEFFNPLFSAFGRPTIDEVEPSSYVLTVSLSSDEAEEVLDDGEYERNILSTRKYRTHHAGGKQWAVGSYALDPVDDPWQQHVILFDNPDGTTDVYSHKEASVRRPSAHHGGAEYELGDPDGRVRDLFDGHEAHEQRQ